jgi:hypothetical protein
MTAIASTIDDGRVIFSAKKAQLCTTSNEQNTLRRLLIVMLNGPLTDTTHTIVDSLFMYCSYVSVLPFSPNRIYREALRGRDTIEQRNRLSTFKQRQSATKVRKQGLRYLIDTLTCMDACLQL